MKTLEHDFREIQPRYSQNMLELMVIQGYVRRLLQNQNINRFLKSHYADMFLEIEAVAALESL